MKQVSDTVDNYVSPSYLSKLESNTRSNPTFDMILKIAKVYNLPLEIFATYFEEAQYINEGELENLGITILNNKFIFANVIANVDIKLIIIDILKSIELYVINKGNSRAEECKIVEMLDLLKTTVFDIRQTN